MGSKELLLQHQSVPEHRLEIVTLSKAKNGTNSKEGEKKARNTSSTTLLT